MLAPVQRRFLLAGSSGLLVGLLLAGGLHRLLIPLDVPGLIVTLGVSVLTALLLLALAKFLSGRVSWRGPRLLLLALLVPPLIWMAGDVIYSVLMVRGYARWNARVKRDADGVRQGCQTFTLGAGETALLMIHGFGDSPAIFGRIAPKLAEQGFTCRALRLPGFGMPIEQYRRTTALAWREAVRQELTELRRTHRRVLIVAHSLGGAVAVDVALAETPDLDGVILLAPLINVSGRRSPVLSPRGWFEFLDHALLFTDRVSSPFGPDLKDRSAASLQKLDTFIPKELYRELFGLMDRLAGRARDFRPPLLLLLAGDDAVIDNDAAEHFFKQCQSQPKRRRLFANAGHVLPLDHEWEQVATEIVRFTQELSVR